MENDRRRYPRVACEGIAVLELGSEVPSTARIMNLSAEGCHLIFDDPQQIEQGTEIEMAFELDNMFFAVRAEAKSVRSNQSVGMYFPDMSETGRANLQGLVGLMTQFTHQPATISAPWTAAA
jgi:hypothetical protein